MNEKDEIIGQAALEEIRNLFDEVEQCCEKCDKKLYMSYSNLKKGVKGKTIQDGEYIIIEIDKSIENNIECLRAIVIHELCEAMYLLDNIPNLLNGDGWKPEWQSELFEIFSHTYVNFLVEERGLKSYLTPIEFPRSYCVEFDSEYGTIITICHKIITHPNLLQNRDRVQYYNKYKSQVDTILDNLIEVDFNNKMDYRENIRFALDILKKSGMPKFRIPCLD